jgi:hypothetical protein
LNIKDHQIIKASSTHQTLKGEGGAFRFYRKQIVNKQSVHKQSLKPKTKDHQITEASSAHLTLKGEGDAFRFHFEHEMPNKSLQRPPNR